MPPTFDDGLRRPNSLIGQRVWALLTRVASPRLVAGHANPGRQLRRGAIERAIELVFVEIKNENRVTDLRIGRAMSQISAQPFEPEPLEQVNFSGPGQGAPVGD